MKFSMNGFRRQLSNDVRKLRDISKAVMDGDYYDEEDFVEAVDDVIRHSNVVNCVYQPDDPDFVEMSEIEVGYLGENT